MEVKLLGPDHKKVQFGTDDVAVKVTVVVAQVMLPPVVVTCGALLSPTTDAVADDVQPFSPVTTSV